MQIYVRLRILADVIIFYHFVQRVDKTRDIATYLEARA